MGRLYLTAADHGFASGPHFFRPDSLEAAKAAAGGGADGELLYALFEVFERCAEIGERLRLSLRARLVSKNRERTVRIGSECLIRGIIRCEAGGRVTIGNLVYIGDDTIVSAYQHVDIGDLTLIAHGVHIFDSNSHPTDAEEREQRYRALLGMSPPGAQRVASAPVKIGRRCWIGFNSAVMKGVTIGDDAIVAAYSVVTHDVPPGVTVAGNPARIVKHNLTETGVRRTFAKLLTKTRRFLAGREG